MEKMKFMKRDVVTFQLGDEILEGIIQVCDCGGAVGYDCHTYDIYAIKEKVLYKHIEECNIKKIKSI